MMVREENQIQYIIFRGEDQKKNLIRQKKKAKGKEKETEKKRELFVLSLGGKREREKEIAPELFTDLFNERD